ncbi:hypothetical protein E3E31_03700 [Thermococcus sp. M39]|uniref:hypothetical protein n=1 Tax=unclassified Thermococcus TaxID=2627626 RepID=UPI00143A5579|nr:MULTISPECIES: hypothetical protein [unclassified Thermococcus]NJE07634.1 hypothetical protein [Thermococcus sp. M39]NJE12215.1 hypothetical protein [Thermococcus sp. LS2]
MIVEGVRLKAELTEEQYERAIKLIERLKSRFPNALVKKFKTQEKISFIDVYLGVRLNFDIIIGNRGKPFIAVEMEGNKSKYAFQIMKFFLDELGVEYSFDFDGREVYDALKRKIKAKSLLDYLT